MGQRTTTSDTPRRPTGSLRRPPGPRGRLGAGRLAGFRRNPAAVLLELARRYGDIVFVRAGPIDLYLLSDPDLIKDVLVVSGHSFMKGQGLQEAKRILGEGLLTSEGEFHRRQRRLIQPLFHHTRISGYGEAMVAAAERLTGAWGDGQTVDVHGEMTRLTLAIVGRTLFDTDLEDADAAQVRQALTASLDLFDRLTLPFSRYLERLLLPANRRFGEAKARLDAIVYRMIAERRATGTDGRGDLLSLLLTAQDEQATGGMSDEQVRDEAMTIFLAGHETTANALTWTLYLLSQHPGEQARLHDEVDDVLGDRSPTPDDLPRLSFAERVFAESMRLYPPAWVVGRRALRSHPVGGYVMPPGAIALMSQYVVHHDPRWFPDPFRFDPERFIPEAVAARPRFSYFPFGCGSRLCIGESFAWMEGVLVLATVARRWSLRLAPGQVVALNPVVTLRPKYGMRMTLRERRRA